MFKNACRAMRCILSLFTQLQLMFWWWFAKLASFGMILGCGSLCCNLLQAVSFNAAHTLEQCSHPILTDLHNRLHGQGLAATFKFLEGTLFRSLWERTCFEEALQLDRLRLSRVSGLRLSRVHASHIIRPYRTSSLQCIISHGCVILRRKRNHIPYHCAESYER